MVFNIEIHLTIIKVWSNYSWFIYKKTQRKQLKYYWSQMGQLQGYKHHVYQTGQDDFQA